VTFRIIARFVTLAGVTDVSTLNLNTSPAEKLVVQAVSVVSSYFTALESAGNALAQIEPEVKI
jgi:hypothetical protein